MRQRILAQPMRERHPPDRYAQIAGIGESPKDLADLATWRVFLREKDLALAAVSRAPLPEPPLKRAQRAGAVLARMAALEFFQQRHAVEVRAALQQRKQLGFPDVR
jgi:hypothetical protein